MDKKKRLFILFSFIALLIPSVFAGLRGLDVGTDVKVYALPEFTRCQGIGSLTEYLSTTETDIGYAFIVGISALYAKSFNTLLGLTAFLQLLPIYIVAYRLRQRVSLWSVMFTYYMMFYIIGFNIMRQSIAAAFILLAFLEFYEKRYSKALISIVLAVLFHSSSIIGAAFVLVGMLLYRIKKRSLRVIITGGTVILGVLLMYEWQNIASLLMVLGIIPANKIQTYIDVFTGVNIGIKSYMFEVAISQYLEIFFKTMLFAVPTLFIMFRKRKGFSIDELTKDRFVYSVEMIVLISVLINLMMLLLFHSAYGYRIAIFAEYFTVILVPLSSARRLVRRRKRMKLTRAEMCNYVLLVVSFYILFMYFGNHETLPLYFELY